MSRWLLVLLGTFLASAIVTSPSSGRRAAADVLPTTLIEQARVDGRINPKSIVNSGDGLFLAQNMMYRHSVIVYSQELEHVATISDEVTLSGMATSVRGSPVEAAFTSNGRFAYVTNYQMEGVGFDNPGNDECDDTGDWDHSYVYRIDLSSFEIDQHIAVGSVPKGIVVSDDDERILVANWCGFSLSIIDAASGSETAEVYVGRHPRGIAIVDDVAYVALMGDRDLAVVDLETLEVRRLGDVGAQPRHVVFDEELGFLYVSLNGDGEVAKLDPRNEEVVGRVATGTEPRTIALSDDGRMLYVANYGSDSLAKVDTRDMCVVQVVATESLPIGVTVDDQANRVWVASYTGTIAVFDERRLG